MNVLSDKIEIIAAPTERSLWEETLARYAAALRDRLWSPPLWIVADGRHRRAAEVGLLRVSGRKAIPTKGLCTLASLAGDILDWPVHIALVSPSAAAFALSEILSDNPPEAYRASSDKPGFAEAFWAALIDAESRGYFPNARLPGATGTAPPLPFIELQRRLHRHLERRHLCTPGEFLRRTIKQLEDSSFHFELPAPLFVGPLLQVSPLDKALIAALLARVDRVCLALAPGASIADLLPSSSSGSASHDLASPSSTPISATAYFLRPRTPEAELDATFATIARWVAAGDYHYRDIRIMHPFAAAELPRLLFAARRYRVPAKATFGLPLLQFPGAILLLKLLDLFESGWSRRNLSDVVRSRLINAPVLEKSKYVSCLLETPDAHSHPPWEAWIAVAKNGAGEQVKLQLERLREFDQKGRGQQTRADFADWIRLLCRFTRGNISDANGKEEDSQESLEEQAGWDSLDGLLTELSRSQGRPISRFQLIENLKRGLALARFTPRNPPLDAVEICPSTMEDHLPIPVLFYMSLLSRVPPPGRSSSFLEGETSQTYAEQLRFFNLQLGHAQKALLLSCPLYSDEGDELALSPFLSSIASLPDLETKGSYVLSQAESWRPFDALKGELAGLTADPASDGADRALRISSLRLMKQSGRRWSPTRLDRVIQCYYLHFAADVMKLKPLADTLIEAVTPALLGRIAHQALENYLRAKIRQEPFDVAVWTRVKFQEEIQRFEPHPEADRAGAELVRCLAQFASLGWEKLASGFAPAADRLEFPFGKEDGLPPLVIPSPIGDLFVEGVIDRLDQSSDRRALLIEYKFKKAEGERQEDFFHAVRRAEQPQLPLYWLAAQKLLGLKPAALLQIYLRSPEIRALKSPDVSLLYEDAKTEDLAPPEIEQMLSNVISLLNDKAAAVAAGEITPRPRDFERCGPGNCSYADLCRFRGKPWA